MQIVSDFSSAFSHPRAAALATTTTSNSSISISHSPAIKFHSTNASPSSTLLLASSSSSSSRRCFTCRFDNNSPRFDSSEDDYYNEDENETNEDDCLIECLADGKTEDGVVLISVEKLEKSSRRIRSKVGMEASLDAVWSVLTDYEKLSEFIPGLVVSELVEKEGNRVRLFQVSCSLLRNSTSHFC